jgi:hypothetical protein
MQTYYIWIDKQLNQVTIHFSTIYSLYCIFLLCMYFQHHYFYDLFVNIFDEVYCTFEESLWVRISLYHLHPVHVQINSD